MRWWNWLRDSGNQGALGAIAVVVAGAWTLFTYVHGKDNEVEALPSGPQLGSQSPAALATPQPTIKPTANERPSVNSPEQQVGPTAAPAPSPPPAAAPSPKPVAARLIEALPLENVTVKRPSNPTYIVVGTTVVIKNTSESALHMGVHSVVLKLGDGTTLNVKRVEPLPYCMGGRSPACERQVRNTEEIPPGAELAFNVEFTKPIGPNGKVGRSGTATLSGAMWTLKAEDPNAEFKQSAFRVAGITQVFMLD